MKFLSVVGARPEFVQAARVSQALRARHQEVLVHTGQHYDFEMSGVFFRQLGLPEPDFNLGVGSGSHAWQTSEILRRIEDIMISERPDWVIVRGDTNSTLGAALAAVKLSIQVAHIEAGLRCFDLRVPEEVNRAVVDHVSELLFCPTETGMRNLRREGLEQRAQLVGDVMYEAILHNTKLADQEYGILDRLAVLPKEYLLVTVHRRENTDDPLKIGNIVKALNSVQEPIVFPVHPRTRSILDSLHYSFGSHVRAIAPVNYLQNILLQRQARQVLTDSGGMQKEAYCLGTPCITFRDQTEWVETVEAGWNTLVGTDLVKITNAIADFQPRGPRKDLYGDGQTSAHIVRGLEAADGWR